MNASKVGALKTDRKTFAPIIQIKKTEFHQKGTNGCAEKRGWPFFWGVEEEVRTSRHQNEKEKAHQPKGGGG